MNNDKGETKAGTGCLILVLAILAIGIIAVLNMSANLR